MHILQNYLSSYICFIIICSISIYGCINSDDKYLSTENIFEFSDTLNIYSKYNLGSNSLLNPFRIKNVNDKFIIISERNNNKYLNAFRIPKIKLLYTWVNKGEGPGEFRFPPFYLNTHHDTVIFYESRSRKLSYYEINDSSLTHLKDEQLTFSGQTSALDRVRRINDNLFFTDLKPLPNNKGDFEHIALKPGKDNPLFFFGDYPQSELDGMDKYKEYLKETISSPDGSKFAAFYFYHNLFKIYDNTGQMLKEVDIQDPYIEHPNNASETNYMYRTPCWASDKLIYVLGLNATSDKIYEKPNSKHLTSLEIWNWEGEILDRLWFDRTIHNFTVSEKHQRIYGYNRFNEKSLYIYDISKIIKGLNIN